MLREAGARKHDLAVFADSDEIARPEVLATLKACAPFVEDSSDPALSKILLQAQHFEFGMHCLQGRPWMHGPHVYSVGHLLWRFAASQQRDTDGPISSANSMASQWATMRFETFYGNPSWKNAAWHLSSFGSAADIKLKFQSWGHANTFLTLEQQARSRAATSKREASSAADSRRLSAAARSSLISQDMPRRPSWKPTSGFQPNGYELDALNEARLERCARLCLDPYPQPRRPQAGKAQHVPGCLGLRGEPSIGTHLFDGNASVLLQDGGLPTTFSLPRYAKLLFGRPFAHAYRQRSEELRKQERGQCIDIESIKSRVNA